MKPSSQLLLRRHGVKALIAVLVLGALGTLGYETQWGSNLRPLPVTTGGQVAATGDTSLLPAFVLPALDTGFKETADRPLFLPTRRPIPIITASPQPLMVKGKFRLAGTVVNQDLPFAFLVEIATGKGVRVAKGAEILSTGISVSIIDTARVVLKQGDETEELTLRTAASPPPQVLPPAVPGSPAPGPAQRPPPTGVVVSGVPTFNAPGPVPRQNLPAGPVPPVNPSVVQSGSSALPGFVQSPADAPQNAAPVSQPETAPGNQRRRRIQNAPQ